LWGLSSMSIRECAKTNHLRSVGYGAAALGGLFACSQADAEIIHSGAGNSVTVSERTGSFGYGYFDLDMDGIGGGYDFRLAIQGSSPYGYIQETRFLIADNATNENAWIAGDNTNYGFYSPARLESGAIISAGAGMFVNAFGGELGNRNSGVVREDPWGVFAASDNIATGFLGVRFTGATSGGGVGTLNGWIHIAMDSTKGNATLTILDYAYENSGNAIAAGAIPAPGALALAALACGAAGLRERRKS
ncbi:MAG: hypothetical protein AAGB34_05465, partial [Planctomycetota bacterium]